MHNIMTVQVSLLFLAYLVMVVTFVINNSTTSTHYNAYNLGDSGNLGCRQTFFYVCGD